MSQSSASRFFERHGFTRKIVVTNSPDKNLGQVDCLKLIFDYITMCRSLKVFSNKQRVFFFDCKYNSVARSVVLQTMSAKGGLDPKSSMKTATYLNCYVCILDNIVGVRSVICYSSDPVFDDMEEENRENIANAIKRFSKTHNVALQPSQFVWMSEGKDDTTRETKEIIEDAIKKALKLGHISRNEIRQSIAMCDKGGCFSDHVLEDWEFKRVIKFPSAVHHELSPPDAVWFGIATPKWRAQNRDGTEAFTNQPRNTILLAAELMAVPTKVLVEGIKRIFCIGQRSIDMEKVRKATYYRTYDNQEFHQECHDFYVDHVKAQTVTIPRLEIRGSEWATSPINSGPKQKKRGRNE